MRGNWLYLRLRKLDAYSKPIEDITIKTFSGACITLTCSVIIALLVIMEIHQYTILDYQQELYVDASKGQKLKVTVNIVFPQLACEYLSIDAMDVSGEQQTDVQHDIYKTRVGLDGNAIAETLKQPPLNVSRQNNVTEGEKGEVCGSCYGAEVTPNQCCNTCTSVREAYRLRGWALTHPDNIKQCREEGWKPDAKSPDSEGCHLHGFLLVNKVAGNFHIAPGHSFSGSHMHVHDLSSVGNHEFNTSHEFVELTFGESIPFQSNPLNNAKQFTGDSSVMYTYYVKVVPTTYTYLNGTMVLSNQYSVTKHEKKTVATGQGGRNGLPGVFVNYDINPMLVKIEEKHKSLTRFLTNVCAIVGGIFTVSSLLDAVVYHLSRMYLKYKQAN